MNMQRVQKNTSSSQDYKHCIVVIGANPNNFQQILAVSKQFTHMVGFKEELLLKNKVQILIPSVMDVNHHKFIQAYLKEESNLAKQGGKRMQWLRKNDGSVKPVDIQVASRVTFYNGIELVAMFTEHTKF